MPDDKSVSGPADAAKINVNQEHEVKYWSKTLNTTADGLRAAVKAVGIMAKDVRAHLAKHKK